MMNMNSTGLTFWRGWIQSKNKAERSFSRERDRSRPLKIISVCVRLAFFSQFVG